MRGLPLVLLLSACPAVGPIDPNEPCLEAGYAIARRTEECTNDYDKGVARYELFEQKTRCIPRKVTDELPFPYADLYTCSFAIESLNCDTVAFYGNDFDQWLSSSAACSWVVEVK